MGEAVQRTTVIFSPHAKQQLEAIQNTTRYSYTRILENGLALYAAHLQRRAKKEKKAAEEER